MVRNLFGAMGLLVAGLLAGCGQPAETAKVGKADKAAKAAKGTADADAPKGAAHDHSGWWCDEHGVPEGECSMCSAKVFKASQAKGDVCEKHPDRAKSQCFICDPSLKAKFAARYKAKEGKEPPEPEGQKEPAGEKK